MWGHKEMTSALTQSCQYLDLGLGSRTTRNKFLLYISQLVFGTGFLGGSMVESTCQCRRHQFDPWVWKMPWRRKWQPTPVLLPGKSHGQRSLASYSPWGRKRVRDDLATKQQHMSVVPHSPHSQFCFPWFQLSTVNGSPQILNGTFQK